MKPLKSPVKRDTQKLVNNVSFVSFSVLRPRPEYLKSTLEISLETPYNIAIWVHLTRVARSTGRSEPKSSLRAFFMGIFESSNAAISSFRSSRFFSSGNSHLNANISSFLSARKKFEPNYISARVSVV